MKEQEIRFIEGQIGHTFHNPGLLTQAFIRRSYAKENGGADNEVLEFIGDKVLDLMVIRFLTETYASVGECKEDAPCEVFTSRYQEDKFTELKKSLVERTMLAKRIDMLGLSPFLVMGKGDRQNRVNEEPSVKEDLFEAIIGAVALDAGWDAEELYHVVLIMLDPRSFLGDRLEDNYIKLIQEWVQKTFRQCPVFHMLPAPETEEAASEPPFCCQLVLDPSLPQFRGYGRSKSEARKAACRLAYAYLKQEKLLFTIQSEVKDPTPNNAVGQLETLARRGYFSLPIYEFSQSYDESKNPMWHYLCRIKEIDKIFEADSAGKKEAKKLAAFKMLVYILNHY